MIMIINATATLIDFVVYDFYTYLLYIFIKFMFRSFLSSFSSSSLPILVLVSLLLNSAPILSQVQGAPSKSSKRSTDSLRASSVRKLKRKGSNSCKREFSIIICLGEFEGRIPLLNHLMDPYGTMSLLYLLPQKIYSLGLQGLVFSTK